MEGEDKQEFVKSLTAKEIKKLAKPEFAANPDKFYPTETLRKLGFHRASCPKCGNNYWRHTEKAVTCGDSQCEGKYSFIGRGTGIGRGKDGKKITYAEAWQSFRRSLTSARVPCTAIPRYPVVARWRADVDYVAAGIFCFQPYCVTGELAPPANPLICPQFCLRFNDLDNIGLTGRHYSGFIMLGIQVFNKPNDYKFWNHECVEFNYRWLTEELKIDPDEITFIEDVWAGGGNLGPSIEYFVSGLELGNMVFMQFKTFPDGHREPLQVQVIDVGIGLERVPWLINGSATSYMDVFPRALTFLMEKTGININAGIWDSYGPLSCLLNVDEVDDVNAIWKQIADKIGQPVEQVKAAIDPIRDAYVVLDHTRSVLMAIEDGSLPSNVGGASNVRNILRRTFALLHKRGWWKSLGMEGFLELFKHHKEDLATIYGPFKEYKSFGPIIELEYERWQTTDDAQKQKLDKLLKKVGNKLSLEDWITAITAWGIPADTIANVTKTDIPGNLWYAIAELQERSVKAVPSVLYSTAHLKETISLYYTNHKLYQFQGKILEIMPNVTNQNKLTIVVLDQSSFYPTSGGQEHDMGTLTIKGKIYNVVDVMKVGPCVLHVLDEPVPGVASDYVGVTVDGEVDAIRREQLRNHHTATHIVYASCRKVLGPHVWQHGAKKSLHQAHLDITHYASLQHQQVRDIENEANRIVHRCKDITKGFMPKDEAEKKYGFHLYQGGVVPGNELRVVNISETDTEACCGTHCDNTAEVGAIKITKTARISDGILRLYFVAGENALKLLNEEATILHKLTQEWGVEQDAINQTATRFFDGYKRYGALVAKQSSQILNLQVRAHLLDPNSKLLVARSTEPNATLFIGNMPNYAQQLKQQGKGVIFVGDSFIYGLLGSPSLFDPKDLQSEFQRLEMEAEQKSKNADDKDKKKKKMEKKEVAPTTTPTTTPAVAKKAAKLVVKNQVEVKGKDASGKKTSTKIDGIVELQVFSSPDQDAIVQFLTTKGFVESE